MNEQVKEQIMFGLKYFPSNIFKSYFNKKSLSGAELRKNSGFIRGICHPDKNYTMIKSANINWVRMDIPFPFNKDGSLSENYINFKKTAAEYEENGLKVMAITPYPYAYIDFGADIRTDKGEAKVKEIARFIIADMAASVSALQITNEMGIPRFTLPLDIDEAAKFIGVQLEEMYPEKGNILLGYNSAGPQPDLHTALKQYHKYCDYVGIDIYLGCFSTAPGFMCVFEAVLRYLYGLTKKPVILQEFGYISEGAPKTKAEKRAILNSYGAKNEKDAQKNIVDFVNSLPPHFSEHVKYITENNEDRYYDTLFRTDIKNHLYKELPRITKIPRCPHTPEGQANFYKELISLLYKLDFVAGCFIYCYMDSDRCYICGQEGCPTETRWGLVDTKGNPKPSFNAVRNEFGRIKWLENTEKKRK